MPEKERWVLAYRPDDLIFCNTNNGTERINEELKYEELDGYTNCTLSELLSIIIENFLPRLYQKYIELNVKCTSGHKQYQQGINENFKDRPSRMVRDLLENEQKVMERMLLSVRCIRPLSETRFHVSSDDPTIFDPTENEKFYTVELGSDNQSPFCTCATYRRNRTLCKHFSAVFKSGQRSFTDLSSLYLNHPLHSLDQDLFSNEDQELEI